MLTEDENNRSQKQEKEEEKGGLERCLSVRETDKHD